MFSKIKKRASAVKFGFSLKIGALAPWPSGDKACAVGWQRGKKRRGATEGRLPEQIPGQLGTAVRFNEIIHMSATLYMVCMDLEHGHILIVCLIWGMNGVK